MARQEGFDESAATPSPQPSPARGEGALADQEMRERARRMVYERLALLSAVIWVVGTAILFIATVPVVDRPQRYIAVAMLIPLVPAAIPWLFYGLISETIARRWSAESADNSR
jgi:hypothetical protein